MADTSFGERVWIVQGVEQDLRTDGRSRLSYRPLGVEANIIAQADGSARLHLGATDVLVGVKVGLATVAALVPAAAAAALAAAAGATLGIQLSHNVHGTGEKMSSFTVQVELAVPDSSTPDQGQVQVSVECSSCASPEFKVREHGTFGLAHIKACQLNQTAYEEPPSRASKFAGSMLFGHVTGGWHVAAAAGLRHCCMLAASGHCCMQVTALAVLCAVGPWW
jgi:hypothetical protein